jgi:Flp pilus assembly protein TadD
LDPSFAPAWAALSRAGSVRGGNAVTRQESDEGYALARRAAERALASEPDLVAAHLAMAQVQSEHDFDWKGAAESLRRAQTLAPADAAVIAGAARLAHCFGQKEKAVELGRQAVELDPVNPAVRVDFGVALDSLRRFKEAEAEFRRVIELSPAAPYGHAGVSFSYTVEGRFDEAAAEATQETNEFTRLYALALARWGQKKQPEADATLEQLIKSYADIGAYQVFEVYAFRGENDHAFEWLERAFRQRDPGLAWSKSDIILESLHSDPRWEVFIRKLGLADDQLK